jgi:MoxR-like ATPase
VAADSVRLLVERVSSVVLGHPEVIRMAVAAFVAGGHVLFEDIPGVGKTLLSKAFATSIGGEVSRIQGTADLLPSDLTGVSVFEEEHHDWVFRPGPLFANVVLVDELNRSTPRTQSALLEAMAEKQVSVDGVSHALPDPFFVIATQNPQGDLGTFPLVAGQRDRFAVSLSLGLPGRDAERQLVAGWGGEPALARLQPIADLEVWRRLRHGLDEIVYLHEAASNYALDLVDAVRSRATSAQPLSTRAALTLLRMARANALVAGRDHVTPDDIQSVAGPVIAHRVLEITGGQLASARSFVDDTLRAVPVPPTSTGA